MSYRPPEDHDAVATCGTSIARNETSTTTTATQAISAGCLVAYDTAIGRSITATAKPAGTSQCGGATTTTTVINGITRD